MTSFLILLSVSTAFSVVCPDRADERPNLAAAVRVANWLDEMAMDDPASDGLVWKTVDGGDDTFVHHLYSGNSGVVLFYLQLYRASGDERYLNQARAGGIALCEALEQSDGSSQLGFWVGDTGVAFTLAELADEIDEPRFRESMELIMQRLYERAQNVEGAHPNAIQFNSTTDVISGNAGIGSFLLYRYRKHGDLDALKLAIRLGDGLVHAATSVELSEGSQGLKWMMMPTYQREMPNYSHGTAGVVDFLLELHVDLIGLASDDVVHFQDDYDNRFRTAAVQGGLYLESVAVTQNEATKIAHHFPEEGELYYLGWCHGPTGTAPVFYRLAQVTKEDRWRSLGDKMVRAIHFADIPSNRPDGFWNNVGPCCGSAGVASFLLDQYHARESQDDLNRVFTLTEDLLKRSEEVRLPSDKKGLRWTHAEHRVRPDLLQAQTGFMQGAAGIGMWLLKLDAHQMEQSFPYSIPLRPAQIARESDKSE